MRRKSVRRGWLIIGWAALLSVLLVLLVLSRFDYFAGSGAGEGQEQSTREQLPSSSDSRRRNIYDRNYRELGVSFRLTAIYARPLEIIDIDAAAVTLAGDLGVDEGELQSLLKAERSFVWLARKLPAQRAEKILSHGIVGVYGINEMYRFYPQQQAAAHILGFVKDDQGLAGVEFSYDNVLRGAAGHEAELASMRLGGQGGVTEKGAHLVLTLDLRMQSLLEQQLGRLVANTSAASAVGMIMDGNGEVLAMASLPTYDPNRYWEFAAAERRNRVITDPVFPGGLSRIFMAGAEYQRQGAVTTVAPQGSPWVADREGVYLCPGLSRIPAENPGATGVDTLVAHLGFGARTGIDLPVEQGEGDGEGSDVQPFRAGDSTASTSALRLVTAFARLLKGGVAVKPHLLGAIWDESGVRQVPVSGVAGIATLRPGIGPAVVGALAGGRDSALRSGVFAESLVAENLVDGDPALLEKEMVVTHSLPVEKATPVEDSVPAAARSAQAGGDPEADAEAGEVVVQPAPTRFHATLLGWMPAAGSDLFMVVALSGAKFDIASPSPLGGMGPSVLRTVAGMGRRAVAPPKALPPERGGEGVYEAWLAQQRQQPEVKQVATSEPLSETMIDVTGYSLRKALQALQPYGLPVKVEGSGRVVEQRPAGGKSLKGSKAITLKLRVGQ
ncbi:MAG: PASTA domain-containing protein [Desulfobulbaceae bacterium]|nr:PASTA domain-containing protein [Desulfobulbaceae bacterium]